MPVLRLLACDAITVFFMSLPSLARLCLSAIMLAGFFLE
jgi:hypothetical protein